MIEIIVIVFILLHTMKYKANILLNFNIKTKKIYVKLYDIWGKYPNKAVKLGDILYTASSKFYLPDIPIGIYFLENRITEGYLNIKTIKRSYKIPVCILPSDLVVTLEDGSIYPFFLVSNGPKDMKVIIRKKTKIFEKPKELCVITADILIDEIHRRSSYLV